MREARGERVTHRAHHPDPATTPTLPHPAIPPFSVASEVPSHYLPARMAEAFDLIIHIDETRAVTPLDVDAASWQAAIVSAAEAAGYETD